MLTLNNVILHRLREIIKYDTYIRRKNRFLEDRLDDKEPRPERGIDEETFIVCLQVLIESVVV